MKKFKVKWILLGIIYLICAPRIKSAFDDYIFFKSKISSLINYSTLGRGGLNYYYSKSEYLNESNFNNSKDKNFLLLSDSLSKIKKSYEILVYRKKNGVSKLEKIIIYRPIYNFNLKK